MTRRYDYDDLRQAFLKHLYDNRRLKGNCTRRVLLDLFRLNNVTFNRVMWSLIGWEEGEGLVRSENRRGQRGNVRLFIITKKGIDKVEA